jgi:uncharacterized membrane protein YfcA
MIDLSCTHAALLVAGGLVTGVFNTLAGGGSLVSVPLLVLVGLPGTLANGTNRVGIFAQSIVAAWRFRAEGVSGFRRSIPVLVPIALGSLVGAFVISRVADETFETLFGVLMVLLLVPILFGAPTATGEARGWLSSPRASFLVFFGIGLYGGAFQAGVGIALVIALSYAGYDLVRANSIKVVVNAALTAVALPVFLAQRQVVWIPALLLAAGYGLGGALGARLAVRGGERVIRPVLAVAVVALAGRMLGLY